MGIQRIDLLVKQDEDGFNSVRTNRILQSGELLVALPNEQTAKGWENSDWLKEMLLKAEQLNIEIWAWWPVFHDAQMAKQFPKYAYHTNKNEIFVDPSVFTIQQRQEELIRKLLNEYNFKGISLDWTRYNDWQQGIDSSLAKQFFDQEGVVLTKKYLQDEYYRARWYELRASVICYPHTYCCANNFYQPLDFFISFFRT